MSVRGAILKDYAECLEAMLGLQWINCAMGTREEWGQKKAVINSQHPCVQRGRILLSFTVVMPQNALHCEFTVLCGRI